jgi:hypothetical protein
MRVNCTLSFQLQCLQLYEINRTWKARGTRRSAGLVSHKLGMPHVLPLLWGEIHVNYFVHIISSRSIRYLALHLSDS